MAALALLLPFFSIRLLLWEFSAALEGSGKGSISISIHHSLGQFIITYTRVGDSAPTFLILYRSRHVAVHCPLR